MREQLEAKIAEAEDRLDTLQFSYQRHHVEGYIAGLTAALDLL